MTLFSVVIYRKTDQRIEFYTPVSAVEQKVTMSMILPGYLNHYHAQYPPEQHARQAVEHSEAMPMILLG